ncbi:MAG: hypothetical protein JKY25_01005 [Robiginitomaculum sp.]|nr:hypothetical protein [Robiginitomaculum sp.]
MTKTTKLPPTLKRKDFDSTEEYELYLAAEQGEFIPVKNLDKRQKQLAQIARNTLKRKPVTFRAYTRDIQKLKAMALRQGIPYQTLLTSVLHRYVTGELKEDASL